MKAPQAVTTRYATNLLAAGHNQLFTISHIRAEATIVGNANIGQHYIAVVSADGPEEPKRGYGATPLAAVVRALECWGVTFR